MNEIQKGPFWVVCGKISDETSFHRTELLCYPVSVNASPSPSHIDVWKEVYPGYKHHGTIIHAGELRFDMEKPLFTPIQYVSCFQNLRKPYVRNLILVILNLFTKLTTQSIINMESNIQKMRKGNTDIHKK